MGKTASVRDKNVQAGEEYYDDGHCPHGKPSDGECDICDTIDGRVVEMVNEYASTCDGDCAQLTSHENLTMDPVTQLGYCEDCIPLLPEEIRNRLDRDPEEG